MATKNEESNGDKIAEHMRAIEKLGGVVVVWTTADMPGRSEVKRAEQLREVADGLEEYMISKGADYICDQLDC